jgi:hypothetical protein
MQFLDTLRRLYSLDYDTSYDRGYGLWSEFEPDSVTMVYLASALAMFQLFPDSCVLITALQVCGGRHCGLVTNGATRRPGASRAPLFWRTLFSNPVPRRTGRQFT